MNFFAYIYYRIAKLMFKKDGKTASLALVLISLMQGFFFLLLITPIIRYYYLIQISSHPKDYGWLAGILYTILIIMNYLSHHKNYEDYCLKWDKEKGIKRILKGALVIIALFLPMIIFITLNVNGH
jgi:hypothetical protein